MKTGPAKPSLRLHSEISIQPENVVIGGGAVGRVPIPAGIRRESLLAPSLPLSIIVLGVRDSLYIYL